MKQPINAGKSERILCAAIFFTVFSLLITNPKTPAADAHKVLKVGFVCVGSINDQGWNQSHNIGRLRLQSSLANQVETSIAEKVPENADVERVMDKMIAQGNSLIFSTSYGYLEPLTRVAARHPNVTFMQVNRFASAKNIGTYVSWLYQPMYIAGVVAGRMTKTNTLGFIAAHPVPTLLMSVNALELGARSVNPKVRTKVIFTNSWSDTSLEAEAMKTLKESGVDILAYELDNQNAILNNAKSLNLKVIGCYSDACALAPNQWLTGSYFDWGTLYIKVTQAVLQNRWAPTEHISGMKEGYIKLASFGNSVPAAVRQEAVSLKERIDKGQLDVFKGPLQDREGRERLAAGVTAKAKWLNSMDFFVAGVDGALPSKRASN